MSNSGPVVARVVRAAGGVVWRRTKKGNVKVLIVHRPKYDDWSLPKGKLDPGETDIECARREVEEETGFECDLGPELHQVSYFDRAKSPKVVRYWAMTTAGGEFRPGDEVDEIRWVKAQDAQRHLTYAHDADVVASLLEVLGEA